MAAEEEPAAAAVAVASSPWRKYVRAKMGAAIRFSLPEPLCFQRRWTAKIGGSPENSPGSAEDSLRAVNSYGRLGRMTSPSAGRAVARIVAQATDAIRSSAESRAFSRSRRLSKRSFIDSNACRASTTRCWISLIKRATHLLPILAQTSFLPPAVRWGRSREWGTVTTRTPSSAPSGQGTDLTRRGMTAGSIEFCRTSSSSVSNLPQAGIGTTWSALGGSSSVSAIPRTKCPP